MTSEKKLICIGLATFRRLGMLEKALNSVARLNLAIDYEVQLLVCDNDPAKSARSVFDAVKASIPFDSIYLNQPQKGIVNVRNTILEYAIEAEAEYLAFFDDDEVVDPNWMVKLLECLHENDAQAVAGKVIYISEVGERITFLKRKVRRSGEPMKSAATSNILFSLPFCQNHKLSFNLVFNDSGGEDSFFFREFKKAGGKIVHCAEAITHETVIEDRNSKKWMLARAYQDAYNFHLMNALTHGRTLGSSISILKIVKLGLRYFFLSQERKRKNRSKINGILRALSNKPYKAYDKIYGY